MEKWQTKQRKSDAPHSQQRFDDEDLISNKRGVFGVQQNHRYDASQNHSKSADNRINAIGALVEYEFDVFKLWQTRREWQRLKIGWNHAAAESANS